MRIRFFYDAAPGDGGGLPPAMGDVDVISTTQSSLGNQERVSNLGDIAAPLDDTNPNPPPAGAEGDKGDGAASGEGDDKDKPKDGDNDMKAPEGDEDELTPEVFFAEMEKLSGVKYDVKYPEGVNPLSPEGFVHRDKIIEERAMDNYEDFLKKTDPRAFAYMMHRQAGRPDAEFFGEHKGFILPTSEQLETSIETQRSVYKQDLLIKGLDEDAADALVEKAIKDNKLKERSVSAYNRMDTEEKQDLAKIEAQAAEQERQRNETVTSTKALLTQSIGNLPNFIVPEADRPALEQFVWDKLQLAADGKKVLLVQELDSNNITKQIEAMLFQYMNGDLSKVVNRKAKTIASQSLQKRNIGAITVPSAGAKTAPKANGYVPLTEVD